MPGNIARPGAILVISTMPADELARAVKCDAVKLWPRSAHYPEIHHTDRAWRVAGWTINGELSQRLRQRRAAQSYDRDYYHSLDDIDRAAVHEHVAALQWRVLISLPVRVYNTDRQYLRETVRAWA